MDEPTNPVLFCSESNLELPEVVSDEDFAKYQHRIKREDLRAEAQLPHAARQWWKFQGRKLGFAAFSYTNPSGHKSWDEAYRKARAMLSQRHERDHGIVLGLIGRYGAGKTLMATGLILEATAKLDSGRYATLLEFNLELEAALKADSGRARIEVLREFRKPKLLCLDDCSGGSESEANMRLFRELLDARYQARRDTILISNVDVGAYMKFLGKALADRAAHGGGYIEFTWESFRK